MMSKSLQYLVMFFCKLENLKKNPENEVFLWLDDFAKK